MLLELETFTILNNTIALFIGALLLLQLWTVL